MITWHQLAIEEHEAAKIGGPTWSAFVRRAERITGMCWSEIRLELDWYAARCLEDLESVAGRHGDAPAVRAVVGETDTPPKET